MNNYDEIVSKIQKCLALSKSSNEHEAAAALRQAQKLMEKFKISELDVRAAEAMECRAAAGAAITVVAWESCLAQVIAEAFGCKVFLATAYPRGSWRYVGCAPAPELAGYAFDVLSRQLRRERAKYIDKNLWRYKRANKTRRADIFCEGWVAAVSKTVAAFARTKDEDAAINAFMAKHYGKLVESNPINRH
ncbi:MAG: DUF2786 domain-containing protein [Azoarcus sp.]|jgi:hypothetical protein|nr:DUF2786 domain-containing protein [Azoarcus sp.]